MLINVILFQFKEMISIHNHNSQYVSYVVIRKEFPSLI